MVITVRNPVHAVLFLITAFFSAAGLILLLGAEFLAMIIVIVYVGAIAVLFLFVVMMLDIDFLKLREGFLRQLPLGLIIGAILVAELILMAAAWRYHAAPTIADLPVLAQSNTEAIGSVLYTRYIHLFQGAGLILLVAMIGAIVLTLRVREDTKRQNIGQQIARRREDSITLKDVRPRQRL